MCIQFYIGRLLRYMVEGDKQSSAGSLIFIIRIGEEYVVVCNEPAVSVNSPEIGEVKCILWLSGRIRRIVAVVSPYCYYIVCSCEACSNASSR